MPGVKSSYRFNQRIINHKLKKDEETFTSPRIGTEDINPQITGKVLKHFPGRRS